MCIWFNIKIYNYKYEYAEYKSILDIYIYTLHQIHPPKSQTNPSVFPKVADAAEELSKAQGQDAVVGLASAAALTACELELGAGKAEEMMEGFSLEKAQVECHLEILWDVFFFFFLGGGRVLGWWVDGS